MQQLFLAQKYPLLVPMATTKCVISLLTFCLGVFNMMKMDKLNEKRGVRTSTAQNVKDLLLTLFLTIVQLAVLVLHICLLVLLSMMTVFSWSWTDETPESRHLCFLLPFLPFCLASILQFLLFQKYVRPKSADEQRFAFLSVIFPVRIFLIRNQATAFKYYTLSLLNISGSLLLSSIFLIAAVYNLTEKEDPHHQLLLVVVEFFLPHLLWEVHLMLTASMLLWHFVISPSLETDHLCPDYHDIHCRIASFPFYWSCNDHLEGRLKSSTDLKETSHPELPEQLELMNVIQNQEKSKPGNITEDSEDGTNLDIKHTIPVLNISLG